MSQSLCGNICQNIFTSLVNCILWIVIICVYSLPILFGFGIRLIINFIVQKREHSLSPLSPNDILLVREAPDKQPITNGGLIIKVQGELDFVKVRGQFSNQFLLNSNQYENLFCDIVKRRGYLFKRRITPDNWDAHFVHKNVQHDDIESEFVTWFQTKYVEGAPLWQILVINTSSEESWLGFKGHHALMDGYSFVHILDTICQNQAVVKEEDEKKFNLMQEVQLLFTLPLVTIRYLFRHFWFRDGFPSIPKLTEVDNILPLALASVDLLPLKMIRRKLGIKFPSLVYSLQIGALRRALLENSVEMEVALLSTAFPVPNHPRNKLTNHWSGGTVKIPFNESSALKRVLATDISLKAMMDKEGPYLVWKYVAWLPWLIPAWLNYSMALSNLSLFRYRTSMSCILQSEVEYELMGFKVLNVFHAPLMKDSFPQAVLLGCSSSHNEQVDFSLFGHPALFQDQEAMKRLINVHFRMELEQLIQESGLGEIRLNWNEGKKSQ